MPFPFEVDYSEVAANLDAFVDEVLSALQSDFLTLPKGEGFVEYPVFERGYEALKRATRGFREVRAAEVLETVYREPIAFIVIRTILGFTPPEWAYVASQRSSITVSQSAARTLDRRIRVSPLVPLKQNGGPTHARLRALIETACLLLAEGTPEQSPAIIHRLDKGRHQGWAIECSVPRGYRGTLCNVAL